MASEERAHERPIRRAPDAEGRVLPAPLLLPAPLPLLSTPMSLGLRNGRRHEELGGGVRRLGPGAETDRQAEGGLGSARRELQEGQERGKRSEEPASEKLPTKPGFVP